MKIASLLKYSLYLFIFILTVFLLMTVYIYFIGGQSAEMVYSFIVPVCMFAASFLYAGSVKERGLIRGVEIWLVYFVIACVLKFALTESLDAGVCMHLIFLPVAILGGVLGVNLKK